MHLRPYHPEDIALLADIQLQCDKTDPLACYMVRKTDEYPATYRHTTLRFLPTNIARTWYDRVRSGNGRYRCLAVSVPKFERHHHWLVNLDEARPQLGGSQVAGDWKGRNMRYMQSKERTLSLQNRYFDFLDSTMNHEHVSQIMPIISKPLDQGDLQESWELNGTYVSPSWQRRGVGSILLQWGLTQAANECVPIVCKSTSIGVFSYETAGFSSLEEQLFDPYFVPGHRGYHSMVWRPNGKGKGKLGGV